MRTKIEHENRIFKPNSGNLSDRLSGFKTQPWRSTKGPVPLARLSGSEERPEFLQNVWEATSYLTFPYNENAPARSPQNG